MVFPRLSSIIRSLRLVTPVARPIYRTPIRLISSTAVNHNSKLKPQEEEELEDEDDYDLIQAPDLKGIETRWTKLLRDDQHEIIDYLKDQQELNWRSALNLDEKRAAYYLAYGNWGARDANLVSLPETIFKLMSTSLLFVVVGFSLVIYLNDEEERKALEEKSS